MAVTTLLGLPIPSMSETVGKTIPDLASAMQIIDEKLGGSRIVDHNLDVVGPPNGYYWRTEDGRQVCCGTATSTSNATGNIVFNWSHPATFAKVDFCSGIIRASIYKGNGIAAEIGGSYIAIRSSGLPADTNYSVLLFAIGRWK